MKKILICLIMILSILTGCTEKTEEIEETKPSEVVYWGIEEGILYLSPTPQGYAINENTSLLNSKDWNDIPWWRHDGEPFYIGGHGIYGIEILKSENTKITPISTACWFDSCIKCEYIHGLENLDTTFTNNMSGMFSGMTTIKELDVLSLNTSNVSNMESMFSSLIKIEELDLSNFDTSNVTNMSNIFSNCDKLTDINLSSFNTSNVTDMSGMFDDCNSLEHIDVSNFDTSNVKYFGDMFSNTHLTTENTDVSNFDISNAVDIYDISHMFLPHM